MIVYANVEGGVLRSERQPATAPCSGLYGASNTRERAPQCEGAASVQFTVSDDGLAIWLTNRMVAGTVSSFGDLVTADDLRWLQTRQDETLAWITSGVKPPPTVLKKAPAATTPVSAPRSPQPEPDPSVPR
jgi:hypothetical protein